MTLILAQSTDFSSLDLDAFWHKGVTGYLDYQERLNRGHYAIIAELFKPTETRMELCYLNILEAAELATATEIKVRENQRLTAIGQLAARTEYSGVAMAYNDRAVKAANRALSLLNEVSDRLGDIDSPLGRLRDVHLQPEFKTTLEDTKEIFSLGLSEFNFGAEDFREVLSIWDEAASRLSNGGVESVLGYVREQLDTFTRLRQQADRGTAPHSPLPWWKYVIIAALIGAAIFAVVACFVWFACSWVAAAISAAGPALAAWVFGIIDRGC